MAAGVFTVLEVVVLTGLLPRYWSQTNFFVKPHTLTLTPGINDTHSHRVFMNCSIRTNVSRIESLSIVNVTNGRERVIVNAALKNGSSGPFPAKLTAVIPGATVSGGIEQQFIAMTLNRVSCYDEALYGCRALYVETPPNVVNERVTQNLAVNVSPGQLNMTASPAGRTSWTVGDKMNLTCTGPVGRVRKNTKIEWKWEYTDSEDVWILYVGGGDNSTENSTDKRPTQPVSRTCYQTQTSTQQLQLAEEDTNRTYRCSVLYDGRLYDEFAAVYSVGSVEPNGDNEADASNQLNGAEIGGIIAGSLIAVLLISSVVCLFIIQRRRQKEGSDDAGSVDSIQNEPKGGHDEQKTEKGQSTLQESTGSETASEASDLHSGKEEATDVETASETSDLHSSKEEAADEKAATE